MSYDRAAILAKLQQPNTSQTPEVPPDQKCCTGCFDIKPLDAFPKNKAGKNGLNARCKSCVSLYEKNRRLGARQEGFRPRSNLTLATDTNFISLLIDSLNHGETIIFKNNGLEYTVRKRS
jgi:hypothetical protein